MRFSKNDWEKLIRTLSKDSSQVIWTEHAKQQMRKRHITMPIILDVLRKGIIRREPETDIKTGHIKCHMERYCAGQPITAVVALEDEDTSFCIVVTAFNIGD